MSCSGRIANLPSPIIRGGIHYTTHILSAYLHVTSPARVRADVETLGFYLAKGESDDHEAITLEKLKSKLECVLSLEVEKRKNSWANNLNFNLRFGNDKAIASMLASLWRRYLNETSLKKAKLSVYGYALNGNNRILSAQKKEIIALCEFCHQEITVPVGKGFTCPHCGVFFQDFQPQKIKIKHSFESFYVPNYEHDEENVLKKLKTGEFELKKTKKSKTAQLKFNLATDSQIRWSA